MLQLSRAKPGNPASIYIYIYIYIYRKRSGPKIEPWGTPVTIGRVSDLVSFTSTNCCLFDK